MNDATTTLLDHTKKYNIPINHLEYRYIEHCTNGIELEQIYKELIGGENGSYPILEQLTLERIRIIQPISQILQQNKIPLQKIVSFNNELQEINNNSIPLTSVINNQSTKQKSNEEWNKFQEDVSHEFNSDSENNNNQLESTSIAENKRRHTAEQYYLNANTAFKLKNFQQSIDLYTNGNNLAKNPLTFMNRAIAYYNLQNFDASIQDCSEVLAINPEMLTYPGIKELCRRASYHRALCYIAKQEYDQAKRDLDYILTNEPDNNEAQNLLNLLNDQKINSTQITGDDNEHIDTQSSTPLNIPREIGLYKDEINDDDDDDKINNNTIHSKFNSQNMVRSPFNHFNTNPFHTSLNNNNDNDDMQVGDEAGGSDSMGNISDEEQHIVRSGNVSPNRDDDFYTSRLNNRGPLQTPPPSLIKENISINEVIAFVNNKNNKLNSLSTISNNQLNDDTGDKFNNYINNNNTLPTITNHFSPYAQNTTYNNNNTYMQNATITDVISNSSFGSTIQSWLHDWVALQTNRRLSPQYDRPWSKSNRPWSLDRIQHDIERYQRFNDYKNTIEVSKKMLQNGILDYHFYTEEIVNKLSICAQCYLKLNDSMHAIQYATEALQYNKMDNHALISRAQGFDNEKLYLFSYADYSRVPTNDIRYLVIKSRCEKLILQLNSIDKDETWREKLSNINDNENFLTYLKSKTNYTEDNSYEWFRTHADQFYLDACFILAIQYYTYCIELQPNIINSYLKRAACYLKVFEPQKVIADCDKILNEDKTNYLALYYKASAYKILREDDLYELTLKEYIKLQPNNQIVLAEYYSSRRKQIPRKKRRIRILTKLNDNNNNILTYEELENLRLENNLLNSSIEFLNSNNIKEQCSYLLHLSNENLFELFNSMTRKLLEIIINICHIMFQAEQQYKLSIKPYSYIEYCFNILIQLTKLPQINITLLMIDENYRILLDNLISYYSSIYDNNEQLNSLKKL